MKNFKIKLFFIALCSFTFFSCEKESIDNLEVEKELDSKTLFQTQCDINGSTTASPFSVKSYSYTVDFANPDVTWQVLSGDITIINGQNSSTVTLRFGSSFIGGEILATGKNGVDICSDRFLINSGISYVCPNNSCISINQADTCEDIQIHLSCLSNVQSVTLKYSLGGYNRVLFQSFDVDNTSSYTVLSLPSGNWDNYYLTVHASYTLRDGRQCSEIIDTILLDCSFNNPPLISQ